MSTKFVLAECGFDGSFVHNVHTLSIMAGSHHHVQQMLGCWAP